jgi:hypothetical protein
MALACESRYHAQAHRPGASNAKLLTVPVVRKGGAMTRILLLAALLVPVAARAELRRPLPVPSPAGVCPSGYSHSPTSGMCVPNPATRERAIPKAGHAACPPGFTASMGVYCVETGR